MEPNGFDTEFSALSRLGDVDPEECDALADVFLGEPTKKVFEIDPMESDLADDSSPGSTTPPRILQLVVCSHLADAEDYFETFCHAASVEPIRSIGCVKHAGTGWSAQLIGRGHRFNSRRASVAAAMRQVADAADEVNVSLPPHHEIGLLIDGLEGLNDPPDAIVVLTTPVESDVVAAYRQIKSIATFSPDMLERVRVALIADDEQQAHQPLGRLVETAARFLQVQLDSQVIVPPHRTNDSEDDMAHLTDQDDAIETHNQLPSEARRALNPEFQPSLPNDALIEDDHAKQNEARPQVETVTSAAPEDLQPQPQPQSNEPAKNTSCAVEPPSRSLCSVLTSDMAILQVRCPEAPHVVLAVDAAGRMHAFASVHTTDDMQAQPEPLAALTRARAFAARHLPVLVTLDERIRSDAGTPVGHLVSDRFAALEPCLNADLHLHLVVPVKTNSQTVWGVSELHKES